MLEVRDLRFAYGKNAPVLDGVSFTAEDGCSMAVLGRNGAGKSTLIRCIDGILRPQGGSVRLDGREILPLPRREIARLFAYVPQHAGEEELTVFDAVLLGRRPYIRWDASAQDRAVVMDTLAELELEPLMLRMLGELSGGELQRTFLAQVFAQEPRLLLLDEPTNHLDLVYQKQIFALIREWLTEPGHAVVSVVHDLSLARAYGSHATLLDRGKTAAQGSIEEVFRPENLDPVYGMNVNEWMRSLLAAWEPS